MIKALKVAIDKVNALSEEKQEYAAAVLEQIAEAKDDVYRLGEAERQLVREGLHDLDTGNIVPDDEMLDFWTRNRQ